MYCNNCGKKVDDGVSLCPDCNTQLPVGVYTSAPAQPNMTKTAESASPKAKGYAVIISSLLAFPALICLVVDYLGVPPFVHKVLDFFGINSSGFEQGNMSWSLYLIGFIMCIWMAAVLPALKPKHPTITACICLAAVSAYMVLISFVTDGSEWYKRWLLPIFLMITISSALMSVLIANKIIKGSHIPTAIGVQLALLFVGFEVLGDMNIHGEVNLRGSLIAAVTVVGLIIIYEAIHYAVKLNKK